MQYTIIRFGRMIANWVHQRLILLWGFHSKPNDKDVPCAADKAFYRNFPVMHLNNLDDDKALVIIEHVRSIMSLNGTGKIHE